MKAGLLLLIAADVIDILEQKGFILPDGDFGDFSNVTNDLAVVTAVEAALKSRGITAPEKLDAVLNILPLVWALVK